MSSGLSAAADTTNASAMILCNDAFELSVSTASGLNPSNLTDRRHGWVLANSDYVYGFGRPQRVEHRSDTAADGSTTARFIGLAGAALRVTHAFHFPAHQNWFEEWMELENIGSNPLREGAALDHAPLTLRSGFARRVGPPRSEEAALATKWEWLPVPFLKGTGSGTRRTYRFNDLAAGSPAQAAAEGWVLSDGTASVLAIKYNPLAMEHALIDALPAGTDEAGPGVVFGGTGCYRGDPEAVARLAPGGRLRLGTTRYYSVAGDWKQAYYRFRGFMDEKGHRFPVGFNPPVHWNEIYDNPHWWNAPDTEAARAKWYRLEHMLTEAAKARELGCEALYLDPGWDTHFGSSLWGEDRLGSAKSFVTRMRDEYGLKVSLHTPLANWNIDKSYPTNAWIRNAVGENFRTSTWLGFDHGLCSVAPGWWQTKRDRLLALADAGVTFFMFDGPNYTPCYDPNHGHSVPLTREEHVRAYTELARQIHLRHPDVLIEMHDPVLGPVEDRYVPMYYTHERATFDSIWGFEFMWNSMSDIMGGKARSLYYYNLAYNIPLYLHVNLKTDNHHALVFWWFASTCRHLGVGGRDAVPSNATIPEIGIGAGFTPDLDRWEHHKAAMQRYRALDAFFKRGEFYGISEEIHLHILPAKKAFTVNLFNLSGEKRTVGGGIDLRTIGLDPTMKFVSADGLGTVENGHYQVSVELPPWGAKVAEFGPP